MLTPSTGTSPTLPATAAAPTAIAAPRQNWTKTQINAASIFLGFSYFFLTIAGCSNLPKISPEPLYLFFLILAGLIGTASFTLACVVGFELTPMHFREAFKDPVLATLMLLSIFGGSNFDSGGWYGATRLHIDNNTAEAIGIAFCWIARSYIIARSPPLIKNVLIKWRNEQRAFNNIQEATKLLFAAIVGCMGALASLDTFYNAISRPLITYAHLDENNGTLKICAALFTALSVISYAGYAAFWTFFGIDHVVLKEKWQANFLYMTASLIMFGPSLIGSATSPHNPILASLLGGPRAASAFIILSSLLLTLFMPLPPSKKLVRMIIPAHAQQAGTSLALVTTPSSPHTTVGPSP